MPIEENGAEPSEELASTIVSMQTAPRFDERVLSQIGSGARISAEGQRLPQQSCFVDAADFGEGGGVANPCLLQPAQCFRGVDIHPGWIQAEHIAIMDDPARSSIRELLGS